MLNYLNLNLTNLNGSQAEFKITSALVDMISGLLLPIYTAEIVDEAIRADLEKCHQSCKHARDPTPHQLESGSIRRPKPDSLLRIVWMSVALIAMRLPPDHRGQGFLVQFLQELSQLPLFEVPQSAAYSDEVQLGYLWTDDTFCGFKARVLAVYRDITSRQRPEHDAAAAQRCINFSAFVSRLILVGMLDSDEVQAVVLHRPAAFHPRLASQMEGLDVWPSAAA